MTIIPCNLNCKHRKNGYCSLSACEIITNSGGLGCPYFLKKSEKSVGGAKLLQDRGDANREIAER